MLVATFSPTTAWAGKTITQDAGVFTLEGFGPIAAADVLEYDRQGHLAWAYDGLREWVGQVAAAEAKAKAKASAAKAEATAGEAADSDRDGARVDENRRGIRAALKSKRRWQELLRAAGRSKDAEDLELLRAAAQEIHDPWFPPNGKDAGPVIGPQIDDLVARINARLRKLAGRRH